MIVQTMAIEHPERCLEPDVGHELDRRPAGRPGDARGDGVPDDAAADGPRRVRRPGSGCGDLRVEEATSTPRRRRRRAGAAFDRAFYPEGAPRQLAAIYASGDRTEALHGVDVPTLVVHGRDDTLITPERRDGDRGSHPGRHLLLLADMGHDLPEPLWPLLVSTITAFQDLAPVPVAATR